MNYKKQDLNISSVFSDSLDNGCHQVSSLDCVGPTFMFPMSNNSQLNDSLENVHSSFNFRDIAFGEVK
jgi:hypothetical protein